MDTKKEQSTLQSLCVQKDRVIEVDGGRRVLLPEFCKLRNEKWCNYKRLLRLIKNDECSILIIGETGTGKEALADCIWQFSRRKPEARQRINCAEIAPERSASDLFGHEEGAFTGAQAHRSGLLRECNGGILFIDEIGKLTPSTQGQLLRFMEDRKVRSVGADKPDPAQVDVRIVAGMNEGTGGSALIPDLLQRFDFVVELPPLHERGIDILWFLVQPDFLGRQDVVKAITIRTIVSILSKRWIGNIRELQRYCHDRLVGGPSLEEEFSGSRLPESIFDEPDFVNGEEVRLWERFCNFALWAIEQESHKQSGLLNYAEIAHLFELLVVLLNSMQNPTAKFNISLKRLRTLVDIDRDASAFVYDLYPLDHILSLFAPEVKILGPLGGHLLQFRKMNGGRYYPASLPEVLTLFGWRVREFGIRQSLAGSEAVDGEAQSRIPSIDFLKKVSSNCIHDMWRTLGEDPVESAPSLDDLLRESKVTGRDAEICRKYISGMTIKQITCVIEPKMRPSTVRDVLTRVRSAKGAEKLASLLIRTKPGRKRQPR